MDFESTESGGNLSVSRDAFHEFKRFCTLNHISIDTKLAAIQSGVDRIAGKIETRVEERKKEEKERQDKDKADERTMLWQRFILVLCSLLVSIHPIAQFLPAVKHLIGSGP